MVTSSIIKYLLCDDISLGDYQTRKMPSFEDVKRRLFLLDRQNNPDIPDHYYHLNKEFTFQDIGTIPEIFTKGLYRIADKYLELRDKRVYVKPVMQNQWQELITFIPPLLLISAFLSVRVRIDITSREEVAEFYDEYLVPNTRYTALVYPYLPQLELYVKENRGFQDLHMHLNNATETDITFQDYLFEPDKAFEDIRKGYKTELVKEQYEQECAFLNPLTFRDLLKVALRLRSYFYAMLFFPVSANTSEEKKWPDSPEQLINMLNWGGENEVFSGSVYHPFYWTIYHKADKAEYNKRNLLSIEALMYVFLFNQLTCKPNPVLASVFHYYVLILGLTNRLLVQQTDQYGFIQFKKITVNELRERSENTYRNRFFQLQGNELRNISFLEGRFAPKDSMLKLERLLSNIREGWSVLKKQIEDEWVWAARMGMHTQPLVLPQLKLVAHFIKAPDENPDHKIRHKNLRYKIRNQALVLSYMKKNRPHYMEDVVAIDAASSEFDASPEVFAPIFRMLRRNGFKHFTYHAGEDFFHILSGLRAIYEAVEFTDLKAGDRIGHATASGISPRVWRDNIGKRMLIRKGEYLDDLLYVYHLLVNSVEEDSILESLKPKIPFLANRIQEYSNDIYGEFHSLKSLESAWMLRKFCPMMLSTILLSEAEGWQEFKSGNPFKLAQELSVFDFQEWCDIRKELGKNYVSNESTKVCMKYHSQTCREKYDEIIEIDVEDCFSLEEMELLQLALLHYLHEKEIVIETLPTSNVRIGYHASFETYHLWNWIRWEQEGYSIPPIVVGSDDAGIFATNIFNEFANIYCFLTNVKGLRHTKAMTIISQFERNARIYRFG